jgi:hypothetical protein
MTPSCLLPPPLPRSGLRTRPGAGASGFRGLSLALIQAGLVWLQPVLTGELAAGAQLGSTWTGASSSSPMARRGCRVLTFVQLTSLGMMSQAGTLPVRRGWGWGCQGPASLWLNCPLAGHATPAQGTSISTPACFLSCPFSFPASPSPANAVLLCEAFPCPKKLSFHHCKNVTPSYNVLMLVSH